MRVLTSGYGQDELPAEGECHGLHEEVHQIAQREVLHHDTHARLTTRADILHDVGMRQFSDGNDSAHEETSSDQEQEHSYLSTVHSSKKDSSSQSRNFLMATTRPLKMPVGSL